MPEAADPVLTSSAYLLVKAGSVLGRGLDGALASEGLTGREFLVLTHVGDQSMSQQDLSRRLGLDATIVGGIVDGLEARDLVARSRDVDDRRRYVLTLTDAGRRAARRAARSAGAVEAELLAPLSDAQRSQLRSLLNRVMGPHLPWLASRGGATPRPG